MKGFLGIAGGMLMASLAVVSTAKGGDLLPPDRDFLKKAEAFGVTQKHWDSPEFAAVTFPNAYRFTRHYRISRGLLGGGENSSRPRFIHWRDCGLRDGRQSGDVFSGQFVRRYDVRRS